METPKSHQVFRGALIVALIVTYLFQMYKEGEVSPCASKKRRTSELLPVAFSVPSTATTSFLRTPFVFPLPPRLANAKYDILA